MIRIVQIMLSPVCVSEHPSPLLPSPSCPGVTLSSLESAGSSHESQHEMARHQIAGIQETQTRIECWELAGDSRKPEIPDNAITAASQVEESKHSGEGGGTFLHCLALVGPCYYFTQNIDRLSPAWH